MVVAKQKYSVLQIKVLKHNIFGGTFIIFVIKKIPSVGKLVTFSISYHFDEKKWWYAKLIINDLWRRKSGRRAWGGSYAGWYANGEKALGKSDTATGRHPKRK